MVHTFFFQRNWKGCVVESMVSKAVCQFKCGPKVLCAVPNPWGVTRWKMVAKYLSPITRIALPSIPVFPCLSHKKPWISATMALIKEAQRACNFSIIPAIRIIRRRRNKLNAWGSVPWSQKPNSNPHLLAWSPSSKRTTPGFSQCSMGWKDSNHNGRWGKSAQFAKAKGTKATHITTNHFLCLCTIAWRKFYGNIMKYVL